MASKQQQRNTALVGCQHVFFFSKQEKKYSTVINKQKCQHNYNFGFYYIFIFYLNAFMYAIELYTLHVQCSSYPSTCPIYLTLQ
jgi:hypothetical protein